VITTEAKTWLLALACRKVNKPGVPAAVRNAGLLARPATDASHAYGESRSRLRTHPVCDHTQPDPPAHTAQQLLAPNSSRAAMLIRLIISPADEHRSGDRASKTGVVSYWNNGPFFLSCC
jgi:hypothetical protein